MNNAGAFSLYIVWCPLTERVFEKTNTTGFCPYFGRFNLRANLYSFHITIGCKRCRYGIWGEFWIWICFLVHPWPYIQYVNIQDTFLTANFLGFLLLPDKVYPDAKNEFKYRIAKMQTRSEMLVKYGHANLVWDNFEYANSLSIETAP